MLRDASMTPNGDMYKNYIVKRVDRPIEIDADWNKPVWQEIEPIHLSYFMGKEPEHRPKTQVKMAWDNDSVYVIFLVEDRFVRAAATEYFGNVWQDSCVEFFFTPQKEISDGYFNLETNCIGTILMCHQQARGIGRVRPEIKDLEMIQIACSLPKGQVLDPEITESMIWTLEYAIPIEILKRYTKAKTPAPGVIWRANFYKCADNTSHPHWLTWSKIPLDQPDFHQPQYFGYIEFRD